MDLTLTLLEARVLGSLIEKAVTTPDYYPLTLNALTAACNQKSNRDPVMEVDEKAVVRAADTLRDKGLAMQRHAAGARVPKYGHTAERLWELTDEELATLCILLLRGPQTPGEIRSRSGRLCTFADLARVEAVLDGLAARPDGPFVAQLPRQPGRREHRYAHLLCGEVVVEEEAGSAPAEPARLAVGAEDERLASLEREVAALRAELTDLRSRLDQFLRQFE